MLEVNIMVCVFVCVFDYFVFDVLCEKVGDFVCVVEVVVLGVWVCIVLVLCGVIFVYGLVGWMICVVDLVDILDDVWALCGECGLIYVDMLFEGNFLVEGNWWFSSYIGELLVLVDEVLCVLLGLKIGDCIIVGLFGVECSVCIVNFWWIDWDSLGFNYVLVFLLNVIVDVLYNLVVMIDLFVKVDGVKCGGGEFFCWLVCGFLLSLVIEVGGLLV